VSGLEITRKTETLDLPIVPPLNYAQTAVEYEL